ncbi:hypothetical protein SDRG_00838 [Saprolegnia diclina VS20]|uniref:EXS domain-containing protein n=1 Tax=Saprolegnia diclina (strain VS20) TaxID=1156394 RepID=T0R4W6_SAPDV|nr:hypothetical protein SDRG_00838 [Saprolegnia diclina VS20]EQC41991.1 hypothetical protein SDRG_00838 [Saprolegnia diclina VS20]|eukprot:XP_008604560.1 hypothetical protein SDRG_00838 [Saprolegnia diclina VS20]
MEDPNRQLLYEWTRDDDLCSLRAQVRKINGFYKEKLAEYANVLDEYERGVNGTVRAPSVCDPMERRMVELAKHEWIILHQRLLWLRQFQISSHADLTARAPLAITILDDVDFADLDKTNAQIVRLESLVTRVFFGGDWRAANRELYPLSEEHIIWSGFYFGMRTGMMLILLLWVLWDSVIDDSYHHNLWHSSVIAVYRGIGVLVLLAWFWCLQLYLFDQYGLAFLRVFHLKATKSTQYLHLLHQIVPVTCIYLVNLLLYFKVLRGDLGDYIPAHYYPLMLYAFLVLKLIFPLKQRRSLMRTIGRVMAAPFAIVRFRESYVGDILTSLVKVMVDLAWSTCYFASGAFFEEDPKGQDVCSQSDVYRTVVIPLFSALPLWWRFMQSMRRYHDTHARFPHLPNAMKYACAQSIVLFAVFHPNLKQQDREWTVYQSCYMVAWVGTTMYQFVWDIYMDWGLGDLKSGFLRQTLLYPKWTYYVAIVLDFFLRFFWTLTLVPSSGYGPIPGHIQLYLDPVLASAEVFRRSMWGLLRVEYEHIVVQSMDQESPSSTDSEIDYEEEEEDTSPKSYPIRVFIEITVIVVLVVTVALVAIASRSV